MAVLKVVTDQDVDGVTIVINPQTNKLEAHVPPATASAVEIEEVTGITNYNDAFDNRVGQPFSITKGGATYPITKVGRIKGTNWLVLQADGLLPSIPVDNNESSESVVTELVQFNITAESDNGIVSFTRDGSVITGVTTKLISDKPLPVGMSFDVLFTLQDTLVKTVNVVSNGQAEFTVTTGAIRYQHTDPDSEPSGSIDVNNAQNYVTGNTKYAIIQPSIYWHGTLPRD